MNMSIKIEKKTPKGKVWQSCSMEEFLTAVRMTKEILQEEKDTQTAHFYEDSTAMYNLQSGKIVSTPFIQYRLAEGDKCPSCGRTFDKRVAALSRYSDTEICPDCGLKEALDSMPSSR